MSNSLKKVEMFYGKEKTFKDLNDLEKAIKDYINWYNTDRVCKKLKGLSPINFRKQALILLVWPGNLSDQFLGPYYTKM